MLFDKKFYAVTYRRTANASELWILGQVICYFMNTSNSMLHIQEKIMESFVTAHLKIGCDKVCIIRMIKPDH